MNFTEVAPQDRGIIIAKIYHNIWYDETRFGLIMELLNEWEKNPIKEAKFLHEIQDNTIKNNDNEIYI
jgi:hypothetical protein